MQSAELSGLIRTGRVKIHVQALHAAVVFAIERMVDLRPTFSIGAHPLSFQLNGRL